MTARPTPEALLADLAAAGGTIAVVEGRLRLSGPPALLQSDLAGEIRAHKSALLAHLQDAATSMLYTYTTENDCNSATGSPITGQVPEGIDVDGAVAVPEGRTATPEEATATGGHGLLQQWAGRPLATTSAVAPPSPLQQWRCNSPVGIAPEGGAAESATVAVLQSFGGTRLYHDSDAALAMFPDWVQRTGDDANAPEMR